MDRIVTIGNFDGLHLGHLEIMKRLIDVGKAKNLEPMVYVIEKNCLGERILTREDKVDILKDIGICDVYFETFTSKFENTSAYDFIKKVLIDKFNVKAVVVGLDFRFGKNREGDISYLKKFFEVDVLKKVDNISSTGIRELIKMGNVKKANMLLGREFFLRGKVIRGLKIGRTIGFKTANLEIDSKMIVPSNGVYKTRTLYDGNLYNSITNIGYNPTIVGLRHKSIETNIFDFDQDIYDKNIEVYFLDKIREEKKFSSVDELVYNIKNDIKKVRKV